MEGAAHAACREKQRPPASASASASASTASSIARGGGWAELPEVLLLLVLDLLPSVADFFAVAAVCRSWRAISGPPCPSIIDGGRPPLLLSLVIDRGRWVLPRRCRLLSPADPAGSYRCLVRPEALASPVISYSHGHLISCRGRGPLLADIASGDVLRAPDLPPERWLRHGVLTAPLSARDCYLVLVCMHLTRHISLLLRWRVGEREWSEHPHTGILERITVFRGQIFALSIPNSLFTVEFSPHFRIRDLGVQRATEDDPFAMLDEPFPRELVECDGELMLVRFIGTAQALYCIKVDVFRLDLSGPPSWVRVDNLGERALFIDLMHGSSVSCRNPSRWGGRSNCVYLARGASDTWTVLPLDGERTYLHDPQTPLQLPKWPSPIWVYPSMLY